jgi:hypothetical protein
MNFIFSLTSYPARFPYLGLVIDSLINQKVKAKRIVLNIAKDDQEFFNLSFDPVVEVNFVEDLKAAKKLIPTLIKYPNENIITVDDDTVYPDNLSEKLIQGYLNNPGNIITGRARKIAKDNRGHFLPYMKWPLLFNGHDSSTNVMPTGVGGVLYPANIFHKDVLDSSVYKDYLTTDDFWWYTQARRNDVSFVQVKIFNRYTFPNIESIANRGLFYYGNKTKNDQAFFSLISKYGNFTGI